MKNETYQELIRAKKNSDIELMKKLYDENNGDLSIRLEYGKLLAKKRRYNEAYAILGSLLNTSKKMHALFALGKLEARFNNYEAAKEFFSEIIKIKNDDTFALGELGKIEFKLGNINEARMLFERVLNLKEDVFVLREFAKLELNEGNPEKAREYFLRALTLRDDSFIMFELGKLEADQGNIVQARKCFEDVLSKRKNDTFSLLELGRLELSAGNPDKAIEYFEKILLYETNDYVTLELARLEVSRGNIEEARKYYNLLACKNNVYALFELGKLEASLNNIEKSKEYYEKVISLEPDNRCALFELGMIEMNRKNYQKARDMFLSVVEKSHDQYSMHQLGSAEMMLGNIDRARCCFNKAIEKGANCQLFVEFGMLEISQGNLAEARKYFEEARKYDPNNLHVVEHLFIVSIKLDDYNSAFDYLKILKDNNYNVNQKFEMLVYKKLNVFFGDVYSNYNSRQIDYYDELEAIYHIIDKHSDVFNTDIDLFELFNSIQSQLTKENFVNKLVLNDIYDIPYENIAEGCSVLRVITIPNTKHIINMYPLRYTNDNTYVEEQTKKLVKA